MDIINVVNDYSDYTTDELSALRRVYLDRTHQFSLYYLEAHHIKDEKEMDRLQKEIDLVQIEFHSVGNVIRYRLQSFS